MFAAANQQADDFPKTGKSVKKQREWPNQELWTWSWDLWILHGLSKNIMTYEYHTKHQQKLQAIVESGANALYFDHVSQTSWECDQKGDTVKKKQQAQNGVTHAKSMSPN